jgi:hypothetical protein
MTFAIQQKDLLWEIFKYIPVLERENLRRVCKLFQEVVLDARFKNEREVAVEFEKKEFAFIKQFPKELVLALGGRKIFLSLPRIPGEPPSDVHHDTLFKPYLGSDHPFLVFSVKFLKEWKFTALVYPEKDSKNRWLSLDWSFRTLGHQKTHILNEERIECLKNLFNTRLIDMDIFFNQPKYGNTCFLLELH